MGVTLNVNNLLTSIYGGKELPSSLATYVTSKAAPCNKDAQKYAAAADLGFDLAFSMGARAGIAAAEKAALAAPLEQTTLTLQQVKYANPTELGIAADMFTGLAIADTVSSAHGH